MGAMISTAELATIKGCTPRYIRQLAKSGKLPATEKADAANNRKEYLLTLIRWTKKPVSGIITPSVRSLK